MSKIANSAAPTPDSFVLAAIDSSILQSNYANAIEVCQRLRESSDFAKNPDVLFLQARAYLGARDFQNALDTVNLVINAGISGVKYFSLKAQTLLYLGRLSESLEASNITLALDHDCVGAYVSKGLALKYLYRDTEAREAFSQGIKAVEHHPHTRDAKLDLEKAFLARCCERYDLGIKYSNYVIQSEPNYSSGYTHLGYNLFAQYLTQKSEDYSALRAQAISVATPEAFTPFPVSPLASDYYTKAVDAFDKAIALNRTDSIAIYYKGRLLEETGDTDGALELYHQAASLSLGYASPVLALVNIHMSRAEYSHALEHIETFLGMNPLSEQGTLAKAKALVSSDKLVEAQNAIESIIERNPDNYYYYFRKALVQYARSDVDNNETMKTCVEALRLKPDDLDVLYHQSLVFSSLGKHDEALNTIARIIEIKPSFAAAYQAKGFALSEVAKIERSSGASEGDVRVIEDESIAAHHHAIELDSNNPMFYSSLASSLAKFHRIDGLSEATKMASHLLSSSSSKHLEPAQREYVRHQVEKRQELLSEVRKLISEAQGIHQTFESSLYKDSPIATGSIEYGAKALAASSPERTIGHQLSTRRIYETQETVTWEEGFGVSRGKTPELTVPSSAANLNSTLSVGSEAYLAPPSIAVRGQSRASLDSSTANFMQPLIPSCYKGGLNSRISDISIDQMERASAAPSKRFSEDVSDSIFAAAQRNRSISTDVIQKSLVVVSNQFASSAQIEEMLTLLRQVASEQAKLRSDLSYALAHDAEFSAHENDLRVIESDSNLLDYYSGFVNGFQKMFTGYMARSSGVVDKADGFKIPFKSALPIPPIASQAVSLLEAVANFVATTIEDNKETRALHSVPDLYSFLSNFIPKLACRITTGDAKQDEIHELKAGHQGIFKLFLIKASSKIYEQTHKSPQMELGATDAAKLLTAFTSGQVTLTSLTDDEPTIQTLVRLLKDPHFNSSFTDKIKTKLGFRLQPVVEEVDIDDETDTQADAVRSSEVTNSSRNLGAALDSDYVTTSSRREAEPVAQQAHASALAKHWYDCFCCCGMTSVSVDERAHLPMQTHATNLTGFHNPVSDIADV